MANIRGGSWAPVTVLIRGTLYPSQSAAAKALGVTQATVCKALDDGDPDRVGRRGRLIQPVIYKGVRYPSIGQAAKAHGIYASTLNSRWKAGKEPDLVRVEEAQ